MAYSVALLAETDLDEIWYRVIKESGFINTADRLVDSITDRFELLARFPQMGRSRDADLGPGCRSFPVGEYMIFYEILAGDTQILRVLPGRRNIGLLFQR